MAELPPTRGPGFDALDEYEELSDADLRSAPAHSAPVHPGFGAEVGSAPGHEELTTQYQRSALVVAPADPPSAPVRLVPLDEFGGPDESIVELGEDAIVAEQRGAHHPQPRTHVLESYASILISESRSAGETPFPRGEKTVVVRDRRALVDPRRFTKAKVEKSRRRERIVFVSASVLAAVLGCAFVAWLTAPPSLDDSEDAVAVEVTDSAPKQAVSTDSAPVGEPGTVYVPDGADTSPVTAREVKLEELPVEKASR